MSLEVSIAYEAVEATFRMSCAVGCPSCTLVQRWQRSLPVALAAAGFLRAAGIGTLMAGLSEVAREVLFRSGSAIGKTNMVTVGHFVGAGHLCRCISQG